MVTQRSAREKWKYLSLDNLIKRGGIYSIWNIARCRINHKDLTGFPITINICLLTPRSRVFHEKLTGFQLVKKFPAFYGTRGFITAFTSTRHLSLSWASWIQSITQHPISCRSILILSSHLRLGLPNGLFPSGFPTETLYMPLLSPIRAIQINSLYS
jgi:hypothetical protein